MLKKQYLVEVPSQIASAVARQRNKWFLSSVLFFGLGCALYFCLPARIWPHQAALALILLVCGFWRSRRRAMVAFVLQSLACLVAGLLIAALHTQAGPANLLTRTLYSTTVTGVVSALEPRGSRLRATIDPTHIDGLDQDGFDWKVRISFLGDSDLAIGDQISVKARLFPLRPPSVPGDPDFARNLYFSDIGATGFAFGRQFEVSRSQSDKSNEISSLLSYFEVLRQNVSRRIDDGMRPPEAGIAKALIIGERGDVRPDIAEDLRKSGLAHLLAISGLHMGLLCGTVFFLIRLGLAAVPTIALRYPIKKWAAVGAMVAGLVYLGLSGATVPTQRAYVMLLVVWVALLLDRRAISLRLVGVAAVIVLLLRPDVVLGASFQLSFAAVGALVAFYDGPGRRWLDGQGARPWFERAIVYLVGLVITGIIVTAVTAPIIGYHFGRISALGVVANLIAIPVMAFWIMPLIVAALALMPFGVEYPVLWLMQPGLTVLLDTASGLGSVEWGLWYVAGLDAVAVSCAMLALTWCVIWRDRWLVLPVIPILIAGIIIQSRHHSPDILISGDRESWAVFDRDQQVLHIPQKLSSFQKSLWMARFGLRPENEDRHLQTCANDPCRVVMGSDVMGDDVMGGDGQKIIVIANTFANPFYACRNADIVVDLKSDLPQTQCRAAGADILVDDDVLWWQGGVTIDPDNHENPVRSVRTETGGWPWIVIGGRIAR